MNAPLLNQSPRLLFDAELLDILQNPEKGKSGNVSPEMARKELEERLGRLKTLSPLIQEVSRRSDKEGADDWRPNSGEAFTVTVDQEMYEEIKSAL